MKKILTLVFVALVAATAPTASLGGIVINEVIGSTTSADTEFIELFNSSDMSVDISGWIIQEVESDDQASNGTVDDFWTINNGIVLDPGGFYLIGNQEFVDVFEITPDQLEPLSIENSSYTLVLRDTLGTAQYTAFVSDTDGVVPTGLTPDISIGPDGTFLPAGFRLDSDGGTTASILEFSPRPAPSATPTPGGFAVPEPSSVVLLGWVGLAGVVRRRK